MRHENEITGVSAVNANGEVIVFCEGFEFPFDRAVVAGPRVCLINEEHEMKHDRTYGRLTADALVAGAPLLVAHVAGIAPGTRPVATMVYEVEVVHVR